VICFTEVRFLQTYSPFRWSQRPGLFQPFPSLKRSPRPSGLFSLINGSLRPLTRTTTTWCLLLDYKLLENLYPLNPPVTTKLSPPYKTSHPLISKLTPPSLLPPDKSQYQKPTSQIYSLSRTETHLMVKLIWILHLTYRCPNGRHGPAQPEPV
jgi:hypothetical protein